MHHNPRGWVIACCLLTILVPNVRAELKFAQPSVNLGEIRGGQALSQSFSFINSGTEEAEIIEVRPGCGCLSPKLSNTRLKPNEEGRLEIDLRTLGQSAGPHTWTAYVRYRSGEIEGEVPLRISAHVINDVQLQPASLSLIAQGPMTQELTLIDTRPRPLRVEQVHTSSKFLKARIVNQSKNAEGHRQIKLAVDLSGDCPPGQHSASLAIETGDPEYHRLIVPVAVTMSPSAALFAQPSALEINVAADGPAISKFVRVGSALPGPVVIEKVIVAHPALSCTWARGPENAATIRVRVDPGRLDGAMQTTLHIQVAGPQRQTLIVPIQIRRD